MHISLVNQSSLTREQIERGMDAVNQQIEEDFIPAWHVHGRLHLEPDARGEAALFIQDDPDVPGALGFHDVGRRGVPVGFVFASLAASIGESWVSTLSHEALEMLVDPLCNRLSLGPHPRTRRVVPHWHEVADACQGDLYEVRGERVSNFVLPHYFTAHEEAGRKTNHLGLPLRSFGVRPGGYVGVLVRGREEMVLGERAKPRVIAKSHYPTRAAFRRLWQRGDLE